MSRPIKFRAWDGEERKMSSVRAWDFAHGDVEMGKELSPNAHKFEHELILMQFTGLLDRNGKEIYEGDVVKYTAPNMTSRPKVVEWKTLMGGVGFNITNRSRKNGVNRVGSFVVIGNLFENPELLNAKEV